MNSYSGILEPAKREIDEFATGSKAAHWDDAWFVALKQRIDRVISAPDDASAEQGLDAIGWIIVDSGPLGEGFGPSIDKALDAMQRARKRRFKTKREAEQDVHGNTH
jgi:hypothetical protein